MASTPILSVGPLRWRGRRGYRVERSATDIRSAVVPPDRHPPYNWDVGQERQLGPDFEDDVGTRRAVVGTIRLRGARVAVASGPDAGAELTVETDSVVVGSSASCDLQLTDTLVSRNHLRIRPTAEGVHLEDLGSRNGTFVHKLRLGALTVVDPVELRLGETTLLITPHQVVSHEYSQRTEFGGALAESPALRRVFSILEQAAKTTATVLLEGQSGTGKDILAQAIHRESPRAEAPFIVVDCAATPDNLFERELFGHERGAFTGAVSSQPGAFELAEGGTLFLDEVGELPLDMQPKLLRVLENRSFRRLGGTKTTCVDVRVVAATNRNLTKQVKAGEFREDLFYRLSVIRVKVPRLFDRPEDIEPLAQMFLRRVTGRDDRTLPPALLSLLEGYNWPGNVRELRNVIERFATFDRTDVDLLFADADESTAADAPGLEALLRFNEPYHEAKQRVMRAFHSTILPRAVQRAKGSVPAAAQLLGLPKGSMYRLLQALNEDRE